MPFNLGFSGSMVKIVTKIITKIITKIKIHSDMFGVSSNRKKTAAYAAVLRW